jgi:hypothetical protein
MIIGRDHLRWAMAMVAIALAACLAYLVYALFAANGPRGGSWPGLIFAFAGTGIIIFECLLSLRKRYPASPIGRVSTWLRAHVWLGLLSFLLILLHSGMRWGQGLASVLMWMFLLITLSGIAGVILQNWLPRMLLERVPKETLYDQIPHMIRELQIEADERVEFVTADLGIQQDDEEFVRAGGVKQYFDPAQKASAMEKVMAVVSQRKEAPQIETDEQTVRVMKAHYLEEIRPYLTARPPATSGRLFRTAEGVRSYFQFLRMAVPVAAHPVVDDLESICEQRRQLNVQRQIHHWLHGWLYVHAPLSMAFLVLTLIHAVVSLRY